MLSKVKFGGKEYLVESEIPQSRLDSYKKSVGLETTDQIRAVYLDGLDTPGVFHKENEDNLYHLRKSVV